MNDIYPHLVEMTCIEDIRRVYFLDLGVSFNELSDEEKELAYNSQQYLAKKYCEKLKEKLSENQWAQSKRKLPNESNKYVIGFSEDEYDVEIVRYERGLKKWIGKDGKLHNITHWQSLPAVPDLEDEDWEEEE